MNAHRKDASNYVCLLHKVIEIESARPENSDSCTNHRLVWVLLSLIFCKALKLIVSFVCNLSAIKGFLTIRCC